MVLKCTEDRLWALKRLDYLNSINAPDSEYTKLQKYFTNDPDNINKQTKTTDVDLVKEVIKLRDEGYRYRDVAKELAISTSKITDCIKYAKDHLGYETKVILTKKKRMLLDLYNKGYSYNDMQIKLNITAKEVQSIVKFLRANKYITKSLNEIRRELKNEIRGNDRREKVTSEVKEMEGRS